MPPHGNVQLAADSSIVKNYHIRQSPFINIYNCLNINELQWKSRMKSKLPIHFQHKIQMNIYIFTLYRGLLHVENCGVTPYVPLPALLNGIPLSVNNLCPNKTEVCYPMNEHQPTETTGYFLYILYQLIGGIILMRMLIALMGSALSRIQVDIQKLYNKTK